MRTAERDVTNREPKNRDATNRDATESNARYAAVLARDGAQDGSFFYAVRTTGVFCKPSCGARAPRRENVAFYDSMDAAISDGFRACKRCRPDYTGVDVHTEVVTAMCRAIDDAVAADRTVPSLNELARRAGYSSFYVHRVFRSATGLTPRAYANGARASRVRVKLAESETISDAIVDAGYSSSSRFYERATLRLGMTPSQTRRGGHGERIRYAVAETTLGMMLVAATDKGVCAIAFADAPETLVTELEGRFPAATLVADDADFGAVVSSVIAFVESPERGLDLPLDIRGTAFQERVWQALTAVTVGGTITYTELAARIGQPNAARAVASACAANAIAVAVPCHRVVRASGELSGYRWGVDRKAELLRREGAR